jgi:Sodium/hydrogen exchanger family
LTFDREPNQGNCPRIKAFRGRCGREITIMRFWRGKELRRIAALGGSAALAAMAASPAHASEGGLPPLVHDMGIGLFLSGLLAILFARIRFPAIAGYILAGIVAGPLGLRLVTDGANVDTIAELGFVLLLFVIGLEMDVGKILKSGRAIILT